MPHVILLNPPKRKSKIMAIKRRSVRRRRVHRNKPLSAAHKRKISLAIKRRNKSGSSSRRKPATRAVAKVARPAARTRTRTVVKTKYRTRAVAKRRPSRRRTGLSRFGGLGKINLKTLIKKDTLQMAGGAVGATMLSNFVLLKFGSSLPGIQSRMGLAAYRTGIAAVGAVAVSRVNRKVAEGMIIGAAVMALNDLLAYAMGSFGSAAQQTPAATETAGAYHGKTVGAYYPATNGAGSFTPGYQASNQFGSIYSEDSAFPESAW